MLHQDCPKLLLHFLHVSNVTTKKLTPFRSSAPTNQLVFCHEEKEGIFEIPMFDGGKTAFSNMLS
jgi:hypothetical protein